MEIEDFFKIYQKSAWDKDASAMIDLYDEHALIFDMWDQGYVSNPSEWRKIITDWLGTLGEEKVKVEFEMVKIHQSGNVGFASALIQFQAISGDGTVLRSMRNRISLGFSKIEDGWKVIHQHTSAPISSDGLTALLEI
ncbi:nuclear transport factor 2 family protein [Algoriphagus aestuariicola]|jgi:ketosteroid isomerase-like protein|uniref:Nuclear transport factor 2 family protein n=1 Tax=Algoriphagus aestuariicola TaxID=1852016 RepID=A0ABS3C0N0_9BACT|nr:nuclear transport factor 2 family protein [Algoriphagus aestuariicola]MBN7803534.1 nuclear transport factor 2 family protein [Algoriphagus aestuariicola]